MGLLFAGTFEDGVQLVLWKPGRVLRKPRVVLDPFGERRQKKRRLFWPVVGVMAMLCPLHFFGFSGSSAPSVGFVSPSNPSKVEALKQRLCSAVPA